MNTFSPIINQCNIAMHKVIIKIRRPYISCQVNNVLHFSNSSFISLIYNLFFNLMVRHLQKKCKLIKIMKGPYKFVSI